MNTDDSPADPAPRNERAGSDLDGFPIVVSPDLRWADMDAFGHVNNTLFFRYFEIARIRYLGAIEFDRPTGIGPILGYTACRFLRPLTYPDRIRVGVRVTDLQEDRFTQEYVLVSEEEDRVAAVGEGVVVAYDYDHGEKASLPEAVKRRIVALGSGNDGDV